MGDIIDLPADIFFAIIWYLHPRTAVRCRRVSRRWHAVFSSNLVSRLLLFWNFPRCREVRLAIAVSSIPPTIAARLPVNVQVELADFDTHPLPWSSVFSRVARRYWSLDRAIPYAVEKLDLAQSSHEFGSPFSFWGVAPWRRFLRFNSYKSTFHHPDPMWSYSQEDGVLVYPRAAPSLDAQRSGHVYHILDLATGCQTPVPFDVRCKHIRRVRLAQGVLVIEWAEAVAYHQLNDREVVHRHFVTAFDVIRAPSGRSGNQSGHPSPIWRVEFRSEWKLHFLGLPLNKRDRFFSTHTATHYAVYIWQPNRSLYQDDPIEQILVWDISSPSPCRPSQDPMGDWRPVVPWLVSFKSSGLWNGQSRENGNDSAVGIIQEPPNKAALAAAIAGPQVIRRMTWGELAFYGVRQRTLPRLRGLALDDRNLYIIEEDHAWISGPQSSVDPPRVHFVQSTGIPIIPGPTFPQHPSATASNLATTDAGKPNTPSAAVAAVLNNPVYGPVWLDTCGNDNHSVDMRHCRRADMQPLDCPYCAPVSSSLAFAPCHTHPGSQEAKTMPEAIAKPTLAPSPFPGQAPCWRHHDFPYLTISKVDDLAAGVTVTARRCFVLEALSGFMMPTLGVRFSFNPPWRGVEDAGDIRVDERKGKWSRSVADEDRDHHDKNEDSDEDNESLSSQLPPRAREKRFPQHLWEEMMGVGYIAGDERWLIGQDRQGRITILRF
ncbi:uncharacterized protein CTHT_0053530 [Thermochaetoides thermophila DSM 1495]|uniref:F-box domain-containing protein n=1 Tax=Chaetomium thermophilum (strain DSM 1495 / CBS 144.50 / IMI 039719) TaxID=759272 RepID=G0SDZ3_CHATD|nr:hypothetical protein CTHT_0053530 [Thermochaetoides thermophila DSM 1495]EGS18744.1 hypothetical protein CTHT_0053530 [Thermochaetoides thermophila DSM 1495]